MEKIYYEYILINTVLFCYITGNIFQKIEYINIINLYEILNSLIDSYDEDIFI